MIRASLLCLTLLPVLNHFALADDRPNVVVLLADDLGYADVGCHDCRDIPTPNIDQLAASGVRCTSGYSSHPYCSPMRAGMMTGRYQHRFGYERNIAYDPQNNIMGLPAQVPTVASRLQQAGYVTGMLGKWHLGAARPFHPNNRGYDHFYGFLGGGHQYFEVDLRRPLGEGYYAALQRNGTPCDLTEYLTTALTDEAARFIAEHRQAPFFLFVAYNAPHGPLQAPQERIAQFSSISDPKRRTYAAMVSILDDGVGRIVDQLKRYELWEKTVVVFLSDNGGPEHANGSLNDPLRGQKGDVYEGGIRVPFIVSWPGTLPDGDLYRHEVNSIDVSCTALALAGVDLQQAQADGVNLIPYLAGKQQGAPHRAIYWRKDNGVEWAVRAGPLKLLKTAQGAAPELYDLANDISETNDLAGERPEEVARLKQLYDQWNAGNQPPFFIGYSDYHRRMDRKYRELQEEVMVEDATGQGGE